MVNFNAYTPVRFSHLTAYAGIGSIVRDNNDFTMVVTDIRFWQDAKGNSSTDKIRLVERVKQHLNISKDLRMPPFAQINGEKVDGSILPAVIFPSYAKCKYCNRLHHKPWYAVEEGISKKTRCYHCSKASLEQVTWCAVSSKGDLMDAPWHFIAHNNSSRKCEVNYSDAYLEIVSGNKGKPIVRCSKCGASNQFEQSDHKSQKSGQPWLNYQKLDEAIIYTVMEINDPRVYQSQKERAIVIPPESNEDKNSITYKLESDEQRLSDINNSKGIKQKRLFLKAASDFRCAVDDIKKAMEDIDKGKSLLDNITMGEMYNDEFKALIAEDDFNEGANFVTKHKTKEWLKYLKNLPVEGELEKISTWIDTVVAVNRLKVIEVFTGFSRKASDFEEDTEVVVSPDVTNELDWYPAIELFGEGMFFTLNEAVLKKWEDNQNVKLRADELSKRYEESSENEFENLSSVSARFILLHTLSHLLIRELEVSAGYPAASMQERIYCSKGNKMAGILIYTAVPDVAGSLGGIVESVEPNNFLKLLDGVFKHAQWCSLDPVCSEHEGQGPSWLNKAACHACALIPETSCEYNNMFLDRVFIKGHEQQSIPSLLDIVGEING